MKAMILLALLWQDDAAWRYQIPEGFEIQTKKDGRISISAKEAVEGLLILYVPVKAENFRFETMWEVNAGYYSGWVRLVLELYDPRTNQRLHLAMAGYVG